jgi:hypothetical protein
VGSDGIWSIAGKAQRDRNALQVTHWDRTLILRAFTVTMPTRSPERVALGTVSHFRKCRLTRLRQSVPCTGTVSENPFIYDRSGLELLK